MSSFSCPTFHIYHYSHHFACIWSSVVRSSDISGHIYASIRVGFNIKMGPPPGVLTHWGRDKMDTSSQIIFSNAFSWMKMHESCLRFHWSLFLKFELTIFQHRFRQWLGAWPAPSHYLNQWWSIYWRIYASLGLNELTGSVDPANWRIGCTNTFRSDHFSTTESFQLSHA